MPHALYVDHNGLEVFSVPGPHSSVPNGHHYQIRFSGRAPSMTSLPSEIDFQEGPVKSAGVNGVTNEALLAILIDRTKVLNDAFPCEENEVALTHMWDALRSFESRTAKRLARGVEGKNEA